MILSVVYQIIVQHDSFIIVYQLMVICSDKFMDSFLRQLAKSKSTIISDLDRLAIPSPEFLSLAACLFHDKYMIVSRSTYRQKEVLSSSSPRGLIGLIEHSTPGRFFGI